MESGYLVVRRRPEEMWRNLPSAWRVRLMTYRGFGGGEHWPILERWCMSKGASLQLVGGLAPLHLQDIVTEYMGSLLPQMAAELLFIIVGDDCGAHVAPDGFTFWGYDFGVLTEDGEPVFFSVVANELRPGGNPAVVQIISRLNSYYLLPTLDDCRVLGAARRAAFELRATNYLETAYAPELCSAVAIYGRNA